MPETTLTAWQVELDRIELDVMRAERHVAHGTTLTTDFWAPPRDNGPLPEVLRERALSLVARQEACLARMTELLGSTQRQSEVAATIGRATLTDRSRPIYVDVTL
jgi:hypothetical protein